MGRACGGLLRVDGGPRHLLPHRPLLPQEGDQEVQQAARQNRQQGQLGKKGLLRENEMQRERLCRGKGGGKRV